PAKRVAPGLKLSANLAEIVEFAIENQHEAPIGRNHWLVARRTEVQDGQPPGSQANPGRRVHPASRIIRAPVNDRVGHARHSDAQLRLRSRIGVYKSSDSAHDSLVLGAS